MDVRIDMPEEEDFVDQMPNRKTTSFSNKVKNLIIDYRDAVLAMTFIVLMLAHLIMVIVPENYSVDNIRNVFDQNVNTIIEVVINKTEDLRTWRK